MQVPLPKMPKHESLAGPMSAKELKIYMKESIQESELKLQSDASSMRLISSKLSDPSSSNPDYLVWRAYRKITLPNPGKTKSRYLVTKCGRLILIWTLNSVIPKQSLLGEKLTDCLDLTLESLATDPLALRQDRTLRTLLMPYKNFRDTHRRRLEKLYMNYVFEKCQLRLNHSFVILDTYYAADNNDLFGDCRIDNLLDKTLESLVEHILSNDNFELTPDRAEHQAKHWSHLFFDSMIKPIWERFLILSLESPKPFPCPHELVDSLLDKYITQWHERTYISQLGSKLFAIVNERKLDFSEAENS